MKKIIVISALLITSSALYSCSDTNESSDITAASTQPSVNAAASESASPISDSIGTSRLFSSSDNKSAENSNEGVQKSDSSPAKADATLTAENSTDNNTNLKDAINSAIDAQKRGDAIISNKPVTTPVDPDSHAQVITIGEDGTPQNADVAAAPVNEVKQEAKPETTEAVEPVAKNTKTAESTEDSDTALVEKDITPTPVANETKTAERKPQIPASLAYKASKQAADQDAASKNSVIDNSEKNRSENKQEQKDTGKSFFGKSHSIFSENSKPATSVTEEKPQMVESDATSLPAPESAEVGQCIGQVKVYGEYKNEEEKILVKEESHKTVNVPAEYKEVEEEVTVKEAGTKIIEIPASYKTVEEEVVVSPERKEDVVISPAQYEEKSEKVLVKPEEKIWQAKDSDGKIMQLVEIPAEYKTKVTKSLVKEEVKETKTIPAVTKKVKKQVIDQPATTEKQAIPAVTKKISKQVLVADATTKTIVIPAEYKTVIKHVPLSADKLVWQPVICDKNLDSATVKKLQGALIAKGYDLKIADGNMGPVTKKAIADYQKTLGYESAGITQKTLDSLGIKN